MRPLIDDIDDFDFDDNPYVARLLREHRIEELRHTRSKGAGPKHKRRFDDDDDYDGYDDFDDFDKDFDKDFGDYDDYDEREFDSHAGIGIEH